MVPGRVRLAEATVWIVAGHVVTLCGGKSGWWFWFGGIGGDRSCQKDWKVGVYSLIVDDWDYMENGQR